MSISSTARRAGPFFGNGVATDFTFDFKLFKTEELRVVRLPRESSTEIDLVMGVDYDASLNADQDENPGGGVTLRVPLALGDRLTLVSAVPALQPVDLTNQGGFYPDLVNGGLDRTTILVQQLKEEADRTVKTPVSAPNANLTLPLPQGNQIVAWNADGTGLVNLDPSELVSVVAYGNAYADFFNGDGVETAFALTESPGSIYNLHVAISGVTQVPGFDYNWSSGTTLTFAVAPPAGSKIFVRYQRALSEGSGGGGGGDNFRKADRDGGNLTDLDAALFRERLKVGGFNRGAWNAKLNEPAVVSGKGVIGDFYTVTVAGTTAIDGIAAWAAGDQLLFNGVVWTRLAAQAGEEGTNKGAWNALTNTPALVSSVGTEGDFYTVSVAGSTSLNGITSWAVGDRARFKGGVWLKTAADDTRVEAERLGWFDIPVERFGAKAADAAFDNTAAINAAEAWCKANGGGRVVFRADQSYYFKGTLTGDRSYMLWSGQRTRLIYNGTNTTRNLLSFGSSTVERRRVLVDGLVIQSATKMTGGVAVYADRLVESVFNIDVQTQAGNELLGNNIWNGFWLRHGATVSVSGQSFEGQNEAIIVNGAPGATGGKSDLFIDINKIAAWKVGVHQAGGWGGLYLSDHTTLIGNFTHFLEDQALTSENNREFFASGTTFDFTSNATLTPGTGGKGIMLMGPGECLFDFRGCWMAGGVGSIFYIGPNSLARVTITGTRGFICSPDPVDTTLKGDFLTVDSANCDVQLVGCNIKSMQGWAINQRAAGANIYYSGCVFLNNTLGHVNPAIPITPGIFTDNGPARFYRVVETDTFRIGNGISQSTYWKMDAGMPVFGYEPQSFHRFDPSTKKIDWFLNNQTSLQIAPKGISLRSQPFLAYEYITGTLDSAGNAAIPTGAVSPFTVLFGFVSVLNGAAPGRTSEVQVQVESGTYYISTGSAANAGKAFRGVVFYLTGE